MNKLTIRKATLDDLKSIQDLNQELFKHDFEFDKLLNLDWAHQKEGKKFFKTAILNDQHCCFVAILGHEIIGYLIGSIKDIASWRKARQAELENMLVSEEYRRQGVGSQLVRAFINWAKSQQATKAFVSTYAANVNAIKSYEKNGFSKYTIGLEKNIL